MVCSKCLGSTRIIALIDDSEILKNPAFSGINHLGLWNVNRKVPPKAHGPAIEAFILDDSSPIPCVEDYLIDPEYRVEAYL